MKIIAKVDDQHIVITAGANVSNSVKLYTVNYTFSDDWEGFEKIACFEYTDAISEKDIAYVTISENEAVVPWEALKAAGYIRFGVYGINEETGEKKPTVWSQPLSVIQGCQLGNDIDPESSTYEDLVNKLSKKQDKLTAGKNITIENNVISSTGGGGSDLEAGDNITIEDGIISAKDTTYTAGNNVSISEENVISATDTVYDDSAIKEEIATNKTAIETEATKRASAISSLSETINAEISNRQTADESLQLSITAEETRAKAAEEKKQDLLIVGENIEISNNTISAKDTTYTAGDNITISTDNVISAKSTSYDDTEIKNSIQSLQNSKQDKLTAGNNITIEGNVISSTAEGKTYTAGTGIAISEDGVISCTFEDGNEVSY